MAALGTWLVALAGLSAVLSIVAMATDPNTVTVTRGPGEAEFNVAETNGAAAFPGTLAGVAAVVLGLIWCFRLAARARALSPDGKPSPGWALGSWFIPVAHIFLPFMPLWQAWQRLRGKPGPFIAWALCWGGAILFTYVTAVASFAYGFDLAQKQPFGTTVTYELPSHVVTLGYIQAGLGVAAAAALLAVVLETRRMEQEPPSFQAPAGPMAAPPRQPPW